MPVQGKIEQVSESALSLERRKIARLRVATQRLRDLDIEEMGHVERLGRIEQARGNVVSGNGTEKQFQHR